MPVSADELQQRISSASFERPTIAFSRLLQGDPRSALTALTSPESLSPAERTTLADRWGLGGSDWFRSILRVAQNPLTLIGLVLAVRYPIPLAKDLFKLAPSLTGLARKPGLIGRWLGGIDETFAGLKAGRTTLPEAYKGLMRDVLLFNEKHSNRIADAVQEFEKAGGQFTRKTGVLLSARLDGRDQGRKAIFQSLGNLGPEFDRLTDRVRGVYRDIYSEVFQTVDRRALRAALHSSRMTMSEFRSILAAGDESKLKPILEAQQSVRQSMYQILNTAGIDTSVFEKVHRLDRYFPRRSVHSLAEYERQTTELVDATLNEKTLGSRTLASAGRTIHGYARRNKMLPDPEDLKLVREHLRDPGIISRIEQRIQQSANLRTYSYNFVDTTKAYLNSVSRAWSWVVQGHGRDITSALRALESSNLPHNRVRASMLKNTYIPVALGRLNIRQLESAAQWDGLKMTALEQLRSGTLSKMLPEGMKDFLTNGLVQDTGLFNVRNVQGRLASHLTVGALGANPVSATWNMMQSILTTIPVIGVRDTVTGMKSVFRKAPKYFELRKTGLSHELAVERAFPEFAHAALEASPFAFESLVDLDRAWTSGYRATKGYDRVKDAMMTLFRTSENFVRMTAFEGTIAKATREGLSIKEAIPIARRVTEATQFLAGPANKPYLFVNRGPLVGQFASFSSRYLNFLTSTATELGSGAQSGFLNRNWGTLGRAMLASGVTYDAAQEAFGQDLSHGLLFGALPLRPEGAVLSPLPFVPPALSIAASTFQGVTTGDFDPLVRQLPLLVPGGVSLARMSTAYAPGVARTFGRQYADYNNRTPDGHIPVYSTDGRLRANLTPLQVHMTALGIPPGGPAALQQEQELTKYLLSQRDRIIAFKRSYYEALLNNDSREAETVQRDYQRAYPALGPIQIHKAELRATELRLTVPRLERMLERLPPDARQEFAQVVRTVLAQEGEGLLGIDPAYLTTVPTIRKRESYRRPPPANVVEQLTRLKHYVQVDPPIQSVGTNRRRTGFGRVQPHQESLSLSPF